MVHLTSRLRLLVSLLTVICALAVACAPVAAPPPTNTPATSLPAPTTTPPSPTAVPTATSAASAAANPTARGASASATFPVTVTDDAGRKVTFSAAPQRIISLSPGHTETLYALGAGDRVIVTDQYSDFPAENQAKAKLNTYPKPNVEELVSLKPDLIVVLVEGDDFIQQMDGHPDIIILGDSNAPFNAQTPDLVRARSGWNQINAVKNGRIYPLNDAFLSRPGPRLIDGLEQMAKIIHPELFP
jgi:ABC-type Fe3+-hydroxamate transport system substrate-binding protein